jgi:chlorophyll(ide) b reductase
MLLAPGLPVNLWLPVLTGGAIGGLFASLDRFCTMRLWRAPGRPLNVLVTGGSRGLGKALAREFLREGDRVFITSRSERHIEQARRELQSELSADVQVLTCDEQ